MFTGMRLMVTAMIVVFGLMFVAACLSNGNGVDGLTLRSVLEMVPAGF